MATSTIKHTAAQIERIGSFTPASAGITTGEVRVVQRGKTCEAHLYIRNSEYIEAGTDFYPGKISGIAMPPQYFRAFCGVGEQPYSIDKLAYINISTTGEIHVVAQARWMSADIHLVYTVD